MKPVSDLGGHALPPGSGTLPGKILVVDDDETTLVALRSILDDLGQPVVCARSGEDALRKLLRDDFAIILLDVRMAGLDGYETASLIRSRRRTRHIPIIFLSAVDKDQAHLFRGYAAGAVDYVFKPIEPIVLRAKVGIFVELYTQAQRIRRQHEEEKRLLEENLSIRAQQVETANALKRSLAQQSVVIDSLPLSLFVTSNKDGFRSRKFVGGNARQLLKMSEAELQNAEQSWPERIHEADLDGFGGGLEDFKKTGTAASEYRLMCGDGSYRWFFERISLPADEKGNREEAAGLLLDISSQKAMEEHLIHATKMEAIGQMTGGIAHDYNNMLSVVIGSLDRALKQEDLESPLRKRLDLALQAALSCADLTKRLLSFGRKHALAPRVICLGEELSRLEPLFQRVMGGGISIETRCGAEIWPIYLDPSQLEAALVNLGVNARDAMPKGGTLTIAARNLTLASGDADPIGLAPGEYVELSVTDTGIGMSAEVLEKALEPFFTTKESDKGTGLGLSSTLTFMRRSGGTLALSSELGKGTSVRLYLPRTSRAAEYRAEERHSDPKKFDACRVLLVEDNEGVRETAGAMLESLGCQVITATSADQALALEPDLGEIAVLFVDWVMPGSRDGAELAEEFRRRRPEVGVLLTSGNRIAADNDERMAGARMRFLPKPYRQQQLAEKLAELMR